MDPRVVVVVPCHRDPVDAVAASLASALAIPDLRVVVVDDGADRADLDALSDDRVRILHRRENGGPSAALEDGIASTAPGSVICRLDVRDEFYPEAKARQIETVLRGVQASCSPHFDPMLGRSHELPSNWRQHIYTDSCFTTVTAVYQRSVWERVGMDTSLRWAEDWRWALLVEHTIGWDVFPEVTCSAGMYPGGHTDVTGDQRKREARDRDVAQVLELARALANPDMYAHLYSEQWCAKRGKTPLPRRTKR